MGFFIYINMFKTLLGVYFNGDIVFPSGEFVRSIPYANIKIPNETKGFFLVKAFANEEIGTATKVVICNYLQISDEDFNRYTQIK